MQMAWQIYLGVLADLPLRLERVVPLTLLPEPARLAWCNDDDSDHIYITRMMIGAGDVANSAGGKGCPTDNIVPVISICILPDNTVNIVVR